METEFLVLRLMAPLLYLPLKAAGPLAADPFSWQESGGERLFCFELERDKANAFEIAEGLFPGQLVFTGLTALPGRDNKHAPQEAAAGPVVGLPGLGNKHAPPGAASGLVVGLPAGDYLFLQKREVLNREEILYLAAELQKESLWRRLSPEPRFYLRRLYEDGKGVTQLWRPYTS
ncbi:MAG: hypothetical protein LBF78_07200 [Treponema sp.]|jgi:hypothetical protein|nr:hypothetical protein [Treponema sp.]